MRIQNKTSWIRASGFTFAEMMIGATVIGLVMASVYAGTTAVVGSMKATENYSVGQLAAMDYLTLDLRRAKSYNFTTVSGTLTLPLDLYLPQYYAANGQTVNPPQRTLVTSANKKDKKKHKVFNARYYYHYGTLGATVKVQYFLSNGTLYRKEGTQSQRAIGTGIQAVTFGPDATSIAADPVVTTTITFSATARSKKAPPPLSGTTFMREYYYSDD